MIAKIKKLLKDYKTHLIVGGLALLVVIIGLYIKSGDCKNPVPEVVPVEAPADTAIVAEPPVEG